METIQKRLQGLADFVRVTRKRKGYSQPDVAKRGGPSAGWIGALEAGIMDSLPKKATLEKLAKALDVTLDELRSALGEEAPAHQTIVRPELEVIEGFLSTLTNPPTADETAVIRAAEAEEVWYGPLYQPGFWNRTPDDRRGHFIYLEGLTREARKLRLEDARRQQEA